MKVPESSGVNAKVELVPVAKVVLVTPLFTLVTSHCQVNVGEPIAGSLAVPVRVMGVPSTPLVGPAIVAWTSVTVST